MDKGTPQTHPPDKYCAKCGGMRMRVKQLESQLKASQERCERLEGLARAVVDAEFDDILDEGHDNAVRALAAALPE